ncbi:HSF-type DNA-binding domain-containing protein [Ditylenchus destructor]|uniref:HSF-type DNA-binding domain-containing protein n=1 Tax=Ditylenchus destructor TaxID=166010 RepID=A0AAD4QWT8_9BILA|nr:HSF-type DNA-binding domain-containing protein [Ditylenchus destructor]
MTEIKTDIKTEPGRQGNFVIKLWSILHNESIADTICWDASGTSFHVIGVYKFSQVVLPSYFRHKNMSTFVRNLNQYGFRKLFSFDQSILADIKDRTDHSQYYNPLFLRDRPDLLSQIKRQPTQQPNSRGRGTPSMAQRNTNWTSSGQDYKPGNFPTLPKSNFPSGLVYGLSNMPQGLSSLRSGHEHMQSNIHELIRQRGLIRKEVNLLHHQHMKQNQNVGKLIQFLDSLRQNRAGSHASSHNYSEPLTLSSLLQHNNNSSILSHIDQNIRFEHQYYSKNSAFDNSLSPQQPWFQPSAFQWTTSCNGFDGSMEQKFIPSEHIRTAISSSEKAIDVETISPPSTLPSPPVLRRISIEKDESANTYYKQHDQKFQYVPDGFEREYKRRKPQEETNDSFTMTPPVLPEQTNNNIGCQSFPFGVFEPNMMRNVSRAYRESSEWRGIFNTMLESSKGKSDDDMIRHHRKVTRESKMVGQHKYCSS